MVGKRWFRALVVVVVCGIVSSVAPSAAQAQFGGLSKIKKAVERAHQTADSALSTVDSAVSTVSDVSDALTGNRDTTQKVAPASKGGSGSGSGGGTGGKGARAASGGKTNGGASANATSTAGGKTTSTTGAAGSSSKGGTRGAARAGAAAGTNAGVNAGVNAGANAGASTTATVSTSAGNGQATSTARTATKTDKPAVNDANVKKTVAGLKAQYTYLQDNPGEQVMAAATGLKTSGFSQADYTYLSQRIMMYCTVGPTVIAQAFTADEQKALENNRSGILGVCADMTKPVK